MSSLSQQRSRDKIEWHILGLLSVKENLIFHREMVPKGIYFKALSWVVSAAESPSFIMAHMHCLN